MPRHLLGLFQCLCCEYLQALQHIPLLYKVVYLQALLALHQVALLPQEVDLRALLLLQHMEGMTSGIAGGIQGQVLQHLSYKILEVVMSLQLTNSRPWDG